ncbi:MAG TPA: AAA family ATPase, partial [Bryobacteraceae bacterium]|nr:AAA family ATPase [Bryobacteraceae bacterium]
ALTPGGGCHVFLRHPGRHVHTRKAVCPGMDVRGDGGFVVASPSVHANTRRYEWDCDHHPDEVAAADCPAWVTQLICDEATGASSPSAVVHTLHAGPLGLPQAVVADGRESYMRDTVLAVLAGQCRQLHRVPSEQELFDEVWPQYSRKVDFSRPGRGQTEVRAKCRYTLARLSKGLLPKIVVAPEPEAEAPKAGGRPAILHLEDVERLPPPEFLIAGLVPAGGLTVVYGPPKSGKTFLVLSACLHLAASRDWFGRAVKGGAVVYIAGEGVGGLGNRLKAMRQHYGIPSNIPFYVIPRAVNFTDPTAPDALIKLIRDTIGDEPVAMVVVDTLARAMPGADENSAKEVGLVIAGCDRVRDVLGCAVVPIHHQGKDETRGLRGTSAIRGAVDAAFKVNGTGKQVTLRNEDQKDAETAPDMVFDMIEVAVGIGRTSLVPVLSDEKMSQNSGGHLNVPYIQAILLNCLVNLCAAGHSAIVPQVGDNVPPDIQGVNVNDLRAAFYEKLPTHGYEAKKRAFSRSIMALYMRQLIGMKEPWVWLAKAVDA